MGLAGHVRFVMAGSAPDGEIFQTGFWVSGFLISSNEEANAAASTVASLIESDLGPTNQLRLVGEDLTQLTAYAYATTGPDATYIGETVIGSMAGSGSIHGPLQTCMVVSLRTGLAGRRHRGRMYLPAAGLGLVTGSYFPDSNVSDVSTAFAAFFNHVNSAADGNVVVASGVGAMSTAVTEVRCTNKPDIQRRRANKQAATTTAVTVL